LQLGLQSGDAGKNRAHWDAKSDAYQQVHAIQLNTHPCAWGTWAQPEEELRVLVTLQARMSWRWGVARRSGRSS
jgi:hypothetical protein